MEQIILPLVVVYHTACLSLDRDSSFPLYIQFVKNLLILPSFDRPRQFQQAITECTLSMIDVSNDTEVSEAVDGNV